MTCVRLHDTGSDWNYLTAELFYFYWFRWKPDKALQSKKYKTTNQAVTIDKEPFIL